MSATTGLGDRIVGAVIVESWLERARRSLVKIAIIAAICLSSFSSSVYAQSAPFTYQGRLTDGASIAQGTYQMQFSLFGSASGSDQIGSTITLTSVSVTQGVFTVSLNFDAANAFDGGPRWLAISVKRAGDPDYVPLEPRQPITSAPYSIKSQSASAADGLSVGCVECVTNAQIQSLDGAKITGTVANATTAANVSGVVPIENGGTGSTTQNFIDLTTNQSVFGNKRFFQTTTIDLASVGSLTAGSATFTGNASFTGGNAVQMNALEVGNGIAADVISASELNATGSVSGNVVNTQTNFTTAGARVLEASENYLLLGRDTSGVAGLTRATAIGFGAVVGTSDSIVLGTTPGFFSPLPNTRVGIGVSFPTTKLDVGGQVLIRTNIGNPPIGGGLRGLLNVVQTGSGNANLYIQGANGGRGINFSTNAALANNPARLDISEYDGTTYLNRLSISENGNIGIGTTAPTTKLDVEGTVRVGVIGISGISAVCFDASLILSSCSSSRRYKNNVHKFSSGLDLIARLRPVSFNWNANNLADLGLVAEEVAEIEPLLVTRNDRGEVEGVKYDRIGVVLVNAVKEQQAAIKALREQVEMLKSLLCSERPKSAACGR